MELRKYINIIWRRKFTILLTLIATMAVVAVGIKQTVPVYQASTTLRIATSASGSVTSSDYMYTDRLMNTYVDIATSKPIVEELMNQLHLTGVPQIQAEVIANTELIKITVEDTDPAMAAKIANALANILIERSSKLYIGGGKGLTDVLGQQLAASQAELDKTRQQYERLLVQTPPAQQSIDTTKQLLQLQQDNYVSLQGQYTQAKFREEIQGSMISLFEIADVPLHPSKPNVLLYMMLGLVVGLVGGLALALIFENLDTTLYEVEDIEAITKLPMFARIPKYEKKQKNAFEEKFSPLAEAFRNVATSLQLINHQKKVYLLISAEPNQGKSFIASFLARSLAELEKKVIVVDCDTRKSKLHTYFNLPNQCGLKDVLEQREKLGKCIQQSSYEGVHVLTSGSQFAHPSQMLGSAQMAKLIEELRKEYDYILLDSPAVLAVADVTALTPIADSLILIVRQGHAQKGPVLAASNYIARQKGKATFLVVNQAKGMSLYNYYRPVAPKKTINLTNIQKALLRQTK